MTFLVAAMLLAGLLLVAFLVLVFQEGFANQDECAPAAPLPGFIVLPGLDFPTPESLFHDHDIENLKLAPPMWPVARKLVRERKKLALCWLGLLQKDILALWKFRRLLAVCGVPTSATDEVQIAISAILLLQRILLVRVLVRCFGPFVFARRLRNLAARIELTRQSCAKLLRLLPLEGQIEVEHRWLRTVAS